MIRNWTHFKVICLTVSEHQQNLKKHAAVQWRKPLIAYYMSLIETLI